MLRRSSAAARRTGGPALLVVRVRAPAPAVLRRRAPAPTTPRRPGRAAASAGDEVGDPAAASSSSGSIDALLSSGRGGVLPLGGGDAIALPSRTTDELWPSFAFDRETTLRLQLEARVRCRRCRCRPAFGVVGWRPYTPPPPLPPLPLAAAAV
jgi:hypothetical protein